MAIGYDTLDVLTDINDESLAKIEEIVNNEYPNESYTSHQYVSVDCYLCTLTLRCIEQVNDLVKVAIATSRTITKAYGDREGVRDNH